MACFDMAVHPVLERLSVLCVDHICKPLSWQQVDLILVRQIQHEIGELLSFLEHASYTDVLVLWTINGGVLVLLNV
jgi:hypothetical protein